MSQMKQVVLRFIGTAADVRPALQDDGSSIPPGSEYIEAETGKRLVWTGTAWVQSTTGREDLLVEIADELRGVRKDFAELIQLQREALHTAQE